MNSENRSRLKGILSGDVYDLGQPLWGGMPVHPADPPFIFYFIKYHDHTKGTFEGASKSFGTSNSIIVTSMHSGTHLDTPVHMSRDLKVLGEDISKFQREMGFRDLPPEIETIDRVPPLVLRAVLYDIPKLKGVEVLSDNYEISSEDLEKAEESTGIKVGEGECALIRTGFAKFFEGDPDRYMHRYAGIGEEASKWFSKRKIRLIGIDNLALGVPTPFEVHNILLSDNGILTMKNITLEEMSRDKRYESAIVVLPLKIKGGEASIVRPIAIA